MSLHTPKTQAPLVLTPDVSFFIDEVCTTADCTQSGKRATFKIQIEIHLKYTAYANLLLHLFL